MDNKEIIFDRMQEHLQTIEAVCKDAILRNTVSAIADKMVACFNGHNKVYFCGNGGSAADAQHLAAEFSGRFYLDRKVLPSEALHCNTSYMTAVSNDYSYEIVYSRLISGIGNNGDILVGISTSGNSKNIVKAFETCKENGIITVAMVGHDGGTMAKMADYSLIVPSGNTPRIQEAHILLGHILCELVESAIFGKQ